MSQEQLAIVLEYLRQQGLSKSYLKNAVDAWWKIKGGAA